MTYSNLFHFILTEAVLLLEDADYLVLSFKHELSVKLNQQTSYKKNYIKNNNDLIRLLEAFKNEEISNIINKIKHIVTHYYLWLPWSSSSSFPYKWLLNTVKTTERIGR